MVQYKKFSSAVSPLHSEMFFTVTGEGKDFPSQWNSLWEKYEKALAETSCSEETEFYIKIHLSDITNQAPFLRQKLAGRKSFFALLGQMPADLSFAVLEAWHITPMKKEYLPGLLKAEFSHHKAVLFQMEETIAGGSYPQTEKEFLHLQAALEKENANIADHTVRTWLYCRDVDNNYKDLVLARNDFFDTIHLTPQTHFIASTGIEALLEDPHRLVRMDSLSFPGIRKEQIEYLSALDHLSSTAIYNVRFERGTKVIFGDRSHFYISGTASIDSKGEIVHPCDTARQTERMLENIHALLSSRGGSLSDLVQGTLYLRDMAEAKRVKEVLEGNLEKDLPLAIVKAPVCRPGWLVEMEGIAINGKGDPSFAVL